MELLSSTTSAVASRGDDHSTSRFIKAEVNLLRLPFFALQTRGLRNLDGFECRGAISRNGQKHRYTWRITRHATRPFPGPLARAAHLALLGILAEQGLPFTNPVIWTWRDLCRRMDIAYSGRTLRRLKEALRATHGVIIESEGAIYSKTVKEPVQLAEDDRHLYSRLHFSQRRSESGAVTDENRLWLSNWYLDSLNALYTAPLDHDLWRRLNKQSSIASRLYEYLLPVFYRPSPTFRINYPQLAQALPVRREQYLSDCQKQLGPALEALVDANVLEDVQWDKHRTEVAQLKLHRGARLASASATPTVVEGGDSLEGQLEVRPIRNRQRPEQKLIADFYRSWLNQPLHRPTQKELAQARDVIEAYGITKAGKLIPLVIKQLNSEWPSAKTFGAAARLLPAAANAYEQEQRQRKREAERRRAAREAKQKSREKQLVQEEFQDKWNSVWQDLPAPQQERIRTAIVQEQPWLRRTTALLHTSCLKRLSEQFSDTSSENEAN